jgi:tRNA uridine 5-carboxymethylaminomethyl modification enzyme
VTTGWREQLSCFRISTNERAHQLIRDNLHRAPMFNGSIQGTGPRYCPSIEDKVARFAGKTGHPIFLEPEGWRTTELYVQGMSTSLPPDVQLAALRSIDALRKVEITRYGYAVEYDAVDPSELTSSLETRNVRGLFFAGQINGTSGYEEAAGQGILAGVNAAATVQHSEPLILRRDQAYIGVMIDDLVNKPFDEPYRMLTSRAEFRLSLRPSTADARLSGIAADRNLIAPERLREVEIEQLTIYAAVETLRTDRLTPSESTRIRFEGTGIDLPTRATTALELLRRPEVGIHEIASIVAPDLTGMSPEMLLRIEEHAKYEAFVERERREVDRRSALDGKAIPEGIDYEIVDGLRIEAATKLTARRPATIGEAGRLSGVTPSDVAALIIHTAKLEAATT